MLGNVTIASEGGGNLRTTTATDKPLAWSVFYSFTLFNGTWYQAAS